MTPVKVLFSARDIAAQIGVLAAAIKDADKVPSERPLLLICVLRGAFIFTADLLRALESCGVNAEADFIGLSSYGTRRESSGRIKLTQDLESDVTGRDIILVDDVLETGRTLAFAKDLLISRDAKRVRTCVLVNKAGQRDVALEADFTGFEAPDVFVVGYGMDVAGLGRGLPYIGTAPDED